MVILEQNSRFGKWTVVGNPEKFHHSTVWLCKCDCGELQKVDSWALRNGKSKQCIKCKIFITLKSPQVKQKRKETFKKKNFETQPALNEVFGMYKTNAKKRGYEFSLTKELFKNIIVQCCHYCGCEPSKTYYSYNKDHSTFTCNGIDRKNNTLGYTEENSLPCCEPCNRAKLEMSYNEFKSWINRVFHNFGDK